MMRNKEITPMIKLKTKGVKIPMKNKSTLAKLLAEEDVYVVHKQMETAYFDSKKRELGLPIWKDEEMTADIYDLMVCHEIGHALWTPLDMLENARLRKINHSFVNILEDARIEKKVKEKYAGSVGVFNRGYVDLLKKDFFGTAKKDIATYNLIDRINVFFKSADTTIPFSDEEKVWVDRTASTKTPDDVLDLAEELYKWMEENESETDKHDDGNLEMSSPDGESGEGGTADTSAGDGESSEGSEGSAGADSGDEKTEGEDEGSSSGDEKNDKENENGNSDNNKSGSEAESDDDDTSSSDDTSDESDLEGGKDSSGTGGVPKATTDSAFGKAMDELRDKIAENRIYGNIPKVDLDKTILNPKDLLDEFGSYYTTQAKENGPTYWDSCLKEVENFKNESKKTVSYMVKEFEMKKAADQYSRAATSKTGSLDMGKLHTYKYNEDLFKKVTTIPGATNHGMVLVLDWSGSMSDNLRGTLSQLYNLIWFCRRIKIPFEVFAFSDAYDRKDRWECNKDDSFKCGDLALRGFKLLNFFSSDMNTAEEMSMMHILWMYASRFGGYRDWSVDGYPYYPHKNLQLGGTPLNDAIIAMMDFVPKYKKSTGVQKINTIFLTDGASHRLEGIHDYKLNEETGEHDEILTRWNSNWYSNHNDKVIITDPVVNKTYEIEDGNMTNDLLKMLKNRVHGMNVVGFFIAGSGKSGRVDKRTLHGLLPSDGRDKVFEMIKFVNKNKFLALKQLGYDEYYILPGGNALSIETETLDDELIGASKAKLKTAFGKMAKGKILSRPLLNKFVAMVA